jgi:hypothetical protein
VQIIKDLEHYIMALESIKKSCLKNAINNDYKSALLFAGQYVSYSACQSALFELIKKYEKIDIPEEKDMI